MTCSILVGGAWGDEGKGKCITYLCDNDKPNIIARAGVGPNAGHSVEFNGEKYGLRLTPSGFVHTDAKLMIGAGHRRSEERRVGKECRSRWSPYH